MPDAEDRLRAVTTGLDKELKDEIMAAFEEAMGRNRPLRYPVNTDDPLANIDDPGRDPLEGVMDTSAPEASLGERPRASRPRRRARRPATGDSLDAETRRNLAFIRQLQAKIRYNAALDDAGLQSFYEPDYSRDIPGPETMSRMPPTLEQMSSRPRPRPYTEGPMSSTANFYEATRNSPDPMVRGLGMRYRPR